MSLNQNQLHPAGQMVGSTWARIPITALLTVRLASTANLSDLAAVSITMDGQTIAEGDLIWLKDQTAGAENGLHIASEIGASTCVLSRVDPFTSGAPIFPGQKVYVAQGTANGGKTLEYSGTTAGVIGTTALTFEQSVANTSANSWLLTSLQSFREVDANGDVGNIVANGGVLASDTTPILRGDAAESWEISWATGNADPIGYHFTLPPDFDGTGDVTVELWVYSGATDAATFTVESGWDGGALVSDSASDAATKSATVHKITATIAAADIPDAPSFLSLFLTPAAHATDAIQLRSARLRYKPLALVS